MFITNLSSFTISLLFQEGLGEQIELVGLAIWELELVVKEFALEFLIKLEVEMELNRHRS